MHKNVTILNAPVIYIHTPLGPGNCGAFNFSVFLIPLKARHCGVRFVVKSLKVAASQRRLLTMRNNTFLRDIKSPAHPRYCRDSSQVIFLHFSPTMSPLTPALEWRDTNDWCIKYKASSNINSRKLHELPRSHCHKATCVVH